MKTIRSTQQSLVYAPTSLSPEESAAWLSSMGDRSWRVLIDFRNWPIWMPTIANVEQLDQESPARGTRLRVRRGSSELSCTINHWDPPGCLRFSFDVLGGELAFSFRIQENSEQCELLLTVDLERSVQGPLRLFTLFLQWRLRQLGISVITQLSKRIRPIQV